MATVVAMMIALSWGAGAAGAETSTPRVLGVWGDGMVLQVYGGYAELLHTTS
jgi:hypothetical protein